MSRDENPDPSEPVALSRRAYKRSAVIGACIAPDTKRALLRELGRNQTLSSHVATILERHVDGQCSDPKNVLGRIRRILEEAA